MHFPIWHTEKAGDPNFRRTIRLHFSLSRCMVFFRISREETGESCANHELSSNREPNLSSASRIPAFPNFFLRRDRFRHLCPLRKEEK